MAAAAMAPDYRARRRRVFESVFKLNTSQPTPYSTPVQGFPEPGQPFGGQTQSVLGLWADSLNGGVVAASLRETFVLPDEASPRSRTPQQALADHQARYDRAWHWVTSRLSLSSSVSAEDSFGQLPSDSQMQKNEYEQRFDVALGMVLFPQIVLPSIPHVEDLMVWFTVQTRSHLAQHVVPLLRAIAVPHGARFEDNDEAVEAHREVLHDAVQTVRAAMRQYGFCFSRIMGGYSRQLDQIMKNGPSSIGGPLRTAELIERQFEKDVRSFLSTSISPLLHDSLLVVLTDLISKSLEMPAEHSNPRLESSLQKAAEQQLTQLLQSLREVGLASESLRIVLAEVMDRAMIKYIEKAYAGAWEGRRHRDGEYYNDALPDTEPSSSCTAKLHEWVQTIYSSLAMRILSSLDAQEHSRTRPQVSRADIQVWQDIALGRLAALRIRELYDVVLHWPSSYGAVEDLKVAISTTERRLQLTNAFSGALQVRLLHPGCSTLQILQVYIAMIRTFHALDHSKVLLSRVVPSLQMYMCQRDDAVRTVVAGLLANPDEVERAQRRDAKRKASSVPSSIMDDGNDEKLVELAVLLNDPVQQRRLYTDDEDLDWDDMNWLPDPIDAGLNYKRPKSEDVIGTLISALGSQESFVHEFQNIIAERLLSSQINFDLDLKVLDLLKRRFGEAALQNCDVMMKDIFDSGRLDTVIRRDMLGHQPLSPARSATSLSPQAKRYGALQAEGFRAGSTPYNARILSRLYWPDDIVKQDFLLPQPVAAQQERYEESYERHREERKLDWLQQLGQATVELELKDRTLVVDCKTYEAAIIYAFQDDTGDDADEDSPISRTTDELQSMLSMDSELVTSALDFWFSKKVLSQDPTNPELYTVIEEADLPSAAATRPPLIPAASAPAALEGEPSRLLARSAAAAAQRSDSLATSLKAKELERRALYWQFIVGMLTNSGPLMPLAQIAMMMKIMVPDGFPWTNEELQGLLGEKVAEGEMEIVGGRYKLIKK